MKKLEFLIILIFGFFSLCFAEESITVTTYYPSPYGVYNELQLYAHDPAVTTCDDAHKGTLFYKSTDDQVYVCKGATLGWQILGGGDVVCPSGFTNVTAAGRQLGCIETAVHNSGAAVDWRTADNTCFTTYGGRLPYWSEWFIASKNFALTHLDPGTYPFEWLGSMDISSSPYFVSSVWYGDPSTAICTIQDLAATKPYRCWISK